MTKDWVELAQSNINSSQLGTTQTVQQTEMTNTGTSASGSTSLHLIHLLQQVKPTALHKKSTSY